MEVQELVDKLNLSEDEAKILHEESKNTYMELPKIAYKDMPVIYSGFDTSIKNIYDRAVEHFPSGSVFVELGVFHGASIFYLAELIQKSGKDIKVYAVDLWENSIDGKPANIFYQFWANVMKYGFEQIIRPIVFDSAHSAELFYEVDFVFVDADHSYESCMGDIRAWWPKVIYGGWMAGHDYNARQVNRAVNDYFTSEEVENVENMSFLIRG